MSTLNDDEGVGGGIAALAAKAARADAVGAEISGGAPAGGSAQDLVPTQERPAPDMKKAVKKAAKKSSAPESRKSSEGATTQQRNKKASNATTQQRNNADVDAHDDLEEVLEGVLEDEDGEDEDEDEDGFVASAAKGAIDPERPTAQLNNRLPPYLKKLLKFVAFEAGTTEQQVVIEILKGERPALGDSHPKLYKRFYQWAKEGKLK